VGWICRGGPAPGRLRSLSPAHDWAEGGPIPPGCAQPVTGRGVGLAQLALAASAQPQIFLEKIPSSIGLQRRPRTTSPESVDLHLLFRARTLSWHPTSSARPTFKILTKRGCSRHYGRTYMEPVCLRHSHIANSISLTRICTHYCHELGGE
jgi:hypothetical protein